MAAFVVSFGGSGDRRRSRDVCGRMVMKTKVDLGEKDERSVFSTTRKFRGKVMGDPGRVEEFMRENPGIIVTACWSEKYVKHMGDDVWRTSLPPVDFLQFSLRAFTDVRATYDEDSGGIRLESLASSVDCPQLGSATDSFDLDLNGILSGIERNNMAYLDGNAQLEVKMKLPGFLRIVPKHVLESSGSNLTGTILDLMNKNLATNFSSAYTKWLRETSRREKKHITISRTPPSKDKK